MSKPDLTKLLVTYYNGKRNVLIPYSKYIEFQVPWEWRHEFCLCLDPAHPETKPHYDRKCRVCSKRPRYLLLKCRSCRVTYVLGTYEHPKHRSQHCWNCTVKEYGIVEGSVPPPEWATPRKPRTVAETLDTSILEIDLDF